MQVRVCMCVFVWRLPFQRDVVLRSWPNRIPRATRSSFTTENDLLYVSHKETRSKNYVSVIRSRRKPSDPVQCSSLRYVANVSNTVYYLLVKKTVHFKYDFICAFYRWKVWVVSTRKFYNVQAYLLCFIKFTMFPRRQLWSVFFSFNWLYLIQRRALQNLHIWSWSTLSLLI